jgi:hypothetical protein
VDFSPALILSTWTAGLGAGGALVAWWRVVGTGYVWLTAAVVGGAGALSAAAGAGYIAWIGVAAAAAGAAAARLPVASSVAFALASGRFAASVWESEAVAIALLVGGIVFLGAISTEMLLGHWFLVDPTLPRWSLMTLDGIAAIGLVAETAIVLVSGSLILSGPDAAFGIVYLVMVGFCGVLMLGVWGSLREPRYSGVMAATGLSYLAVLVAFGVVTVGRSLVAGGF